MKRPHKAAIQTDSTSTRDPVITAPPRAAVARNRSNDGDGPQSLAREEMLNPSSEGVPIDLKDEDDANGFTEDDNISRNKKAQSGEDKAHLAGKKESIAKLGPRPASIPTAGRKVKAAGLHSNGVPLAESVKSNKSEEGEILGSSTSTKVAGSTETISRPKLSVTRLEEGPERAPNRLSPQVSERATEVALTQHDSLQEDLDKLKERLHHQESELLLLKRERDYHDVRVRHHERTVTALEARLAEHAREITYWSNKHEEVHGQYLKTESDYRILQAGVADRNAMWKREWERKNEHLLEERDRCRDGYHTARRVADELEDENQALRRQVLELKHSISTSTRTEGQVTDDVFREKLQNLGHDVQNWTINNFRRREINLPNVSKASQEELESLVPCYKSLISTSKLNLIQSIVSSILVKEIFSLYFYGLPADRVSQCQQMQDYLRIMGPPASVNQWRSTTLALIRHSQTPTLDASTSALLDALDGHITELLCALTATSTEDPSRKRSLRTILEQAVDLARLFRVQRAQFIVEMPACASTSSADRREVTFDGTCMDEISGEEDDEQQLKARAIRCVTFPCVWKVGDEEGDNVHLRNVIVKAKVLC